MKTITDHGYTTYPRRFNSYKWYKPLAVGGLFVIFIFIAQIAIDIITKFLLGTSVSSTGYDDMDFFTAAGAFSNGASAAAVLPCMILAAIIVKDRPVSSYFSSMGGWRWRIFFRTLAAAFVILGIPTIIQHLVKGNSGNVRFSNRICSNASL